MKLTKLIATMGIPILVALAVSGQVSSQIGTSTTTSKLTSAQIAARQAQLQQDLSIIMPPLPPPPSAAMLQRARAAKVRIAASPLAKQPLSPQPMDQQQVTEFYAVIDLGDLGGSFSRANAINNSGQVVGVANTSDGHQNAFLWSGSTMQDLGILGDNITSSANGINNKSHIVGTSSGGNRHSFLYANGVMQDLGVATSGGVPTRFGAVAINDNDQIVGTSRTLSDGTFTNSYAFLYSNGTIQNLGTLGGDSSQAHGINNSGQIVGSSTTANNTSTHAFLLSNGSMQDIGSLGGSTSQANAINASGDVVGWSYTANDAAQHAFLYSNGGLQDLGTLGNSSISQAFGINAGGQVVGSSDIGGSVTHAFIYSGGSMRDLNDLTVGSTGWTFSIATAINDAGQIVGFGTNPSGQSHAFLLNPLFNGAIQACVNAQTSLPSYGAIPTPAPGEDSLIVFTHGWINPAIETEADVINSVNSMSNSIAQYLIIHGLNNWRVFGYTWTKDANVPIIEGGPIKALYKAIQHGKIVGDSIVQGEWSHVHLIAHSAGAGLIQSATDVIRSESLLSPPPIIHSTFLDPYDGVALEYSIIWGYKADWADCYFSRDLLTGAATQHPLLNAFNVDVTTLDPQADIEQIPNFVSSGPVNSPCYKTESTHSWPVSFYSNTIPPHAFSNYQGFGFPLSEEGGNWNAVSQYTPGNGFQNIGQVKILGPEDPSCIPYVFSPSYLGNGINFPASTTLQSTTGAVEEFINSLKLTTGSPVWVATVITDTNALNYVAFDAEFTSAGGANGLLSVYWDTNMIGLVDEAAVMQGGQHFTLPFPNAAPNTSHVLGFHMDPFTSVHSSIIITNIALGFAGVSQPPVLTVTTNTSNGLLVYQLSGQNADYTIQANSDLTSSNWVDVAILSNTNGTVNFVDQNSANYPYRFYRAVAQ